MASDKDILAIFAKHTVWQDEGDRRTVAEFLDRDPDAPDTFGPLESDDSDSDNDANGDTADDNGNAKDTGDRTDTPKIDKSAPATPATVRNRR